MLSEAGIVLSISTAREQNEDRGDIGLITDIKDWMKKTVMGDTTGQSWQQCLWSPIFRHECKARTDRICNSKELLKCTVII